MSHKGGEDGEEERRSHPEVFSLEGSPPQEEGNQRLCVGRSMSQVHKYLLFFIRKQEAILFLSYNPICFLKKVHKNFSIPSVAA